MRYITIARLRQMGACPRPLRLVKRMFGERIALTDKNAEKAARSTRLCPEAADVYLANRLLPWDVRNSYHHEFGRFLKPSLAQRKLAWLMLVRLLRQHGKWPKGKR